MATGLLIKAVHAGLALLVAAALEPLAGPLAAAAAGLGTFAVTRPLAGRVTRRLRRPDVLERLLESGDVELPQAWVDMLAKAVGDRYVALELEGRVLARSGVSRAPLEHFAVAHDGQITISGGLSESQRELVREVARRTEPVLASAQAREARRAVSHDVHDRVAPALAAVKMLIAARGGLSGAELAGHVDEAEQELERIVSRAAGHGSDLVAAVEVIAGRFTAGGGPDVVVHTPARFDPLSPAVEEAAYAIVLEALNNAVRHAGAHSCAVRFAQEDDLLVVAVEDDGSGFADVEPGVGVRSMRRRAEAVGGELAIASSRAGTRVEARLPRQIARA